MILATATLLNHIAFAQGPVPQGSPLPRILPPRPPSVSPGMPAPAPVQTTAAPEGTVNVSRVAIDGVTAYTIPELAAMTDRLAGPGTPLAAVEAARLAILNRYRDDGYALMAVSAVIDERGVLTFQVTEGRIAEVRLDGDIGPAGSTVLRFLNHLTEKRPIDVATMERWLLLAQDIPGVSLRAILRPSTEEPGALTLVAEVKRTPFSALAAADNSAYPLTGPAQSLFVVTGNSFTEFGDRTEASFYHTSGNTSNFGQLSSEVFAGGTGLRVRIYGGYGPTVPASPLRDVGYRGTTTLFGVSASYPLIRRRERTLDLTAAFEGVESTTAIDGGALPIGQDSLRVLRFGAAFALHDTLLGAARGATNTIRVKLSRGLPALGASAGSGQAGAPPGETVSFTKINAEFGRIQTLFEPWTGATVLLSGLLSGQASGDRLPPSEQFQLGGLQLNPGYYSGQVTGDSALTLYTELRLDDSWSLPLGRLFDVNSQIFGLWSWGETWNEQALRPNRRIASAGGGMRLMLTRYCEFDLTGVSRSVLVTSGANTPPLRSEAVYWRVVLRY